MIEIKRVGNALNKHGKKFLKCYLHESEIQLCQTVETMAGFWAIKEACIKVTGCKMLDIEIYKDNNKPKVIIDGYNIEVSLTHEREYAIAVAINCLRNN